MAAVLCTGLDSVLSLAPAGQVAWIVDDREKFPIHVTVPAGRGPAPSGILVHRSRHLDEQDRTVRFGIPITTPTRTVWDLAAGNSDKLARRAFERAEGTGKLDRARLLTLIEVAPSRKGTRLLRELLDSRPLPLSEVRSWLETLLLHICSEHGFPFPCVNVPLCNYEVDFYWPDADFVIEADGGDHLDPTQRDKDNTRDFVLARAGKLVRRYCYKAMGREREVVREVREILTERLPPAARP